MFDYQGDAVKISDKYNLQNPTIVFNKISKSANVAAVAHNIGWLDCISPKGPLIKGDLENLEGIAHDHHKLNSHAHVKQHKSAKSAKSAKQKISKISKSITINSKKAAKCKLI